MEQSFFFFNDTATTEIYTLSLHDALPISGPTMQAPAITLTVESAAKTRSRQRTRSSGIRGLASGGVWRLDGRDNLALLERHRGLFHDGFIALQSSLDVDRGPEVAAEYHVLKVQLVSGTHDRHTGALRIEDDRGRRDSPARAGGADLEGDVDEHSRKQPVRWVGDVDLGQERPRARIEGSGGAGHRARHRPHQLTSHRNLDG